MQSSISAAKGVTVEPLIRVEGGSAATIILEHLWISGSIEHASAKGLALKHLDHHGYRNTAAGTGRLFLEDVIGKPYVIAHPQAVWGRQVNCEFGEAPLIENHGGTLWLLGYKTEGEMTVLDNRGGTCELLGALFYPLHRVPADRPMIVNRDGRVSLSWMGNGNQDNHYRILVRETRGGETRDFTRDQLPGRGPALYTGYPAPAASPPRR